MNNYNNNSHTNDIEITNKVNKYNKTKQLQKLSIVAVLLIASFIVGYAYSYITSTEKTTATKAETLSNTAGELSTTFTATTDGI